MTDTKHIDTLIEKSAKTDDSGDAMRFAQAALSAAHAITSLADMKKRANDG